MKKWFSFLIPVLFVSVAHAEVPTLKQKVEEHLKSVKAMGYTTSDVAYADVVHAFPSIPLVLVRFRQYPIGFVPPTPLKVSNLFYLEHDVLAHVSDIENLKHFFREKLAPVRGESAAAQTVRAWISLAEEIQTDGFFKFTEPSVEVVLNDHSIVASGGVKVLPNHGDRGALNSKLTFQRNGALISIEHTGKLLAGIRPICQATKLLDADATVRRMAEQDLLTLGSSAKGYLEFIRPQLTPALRSAADQIWNQILVEGR